MLYMDRDKVKGIVDANTTSMTELMSARVKRMNELAQKHGGEAKDYANSPLVKGIKLGFPGSAKIGGKSMFGD